MRWFIPSIHGDYRLEPDGERNCVLTVTSPTPAEKEVVTKFLAQANTRGWTDRKRLSTRTSVSLIRLKASVADAGPLLVAAGAAPVIGALTVLTFKDGGVVADEDPERVADVAQDPKDPAKDAVTVKRPTPCCPRCIPGAIAPANEVLQAFMTPAQHSSWADDRSLVVEGGYSGHRYVLSHRNSPRAVDQTKICYDETDGKILHFHDWAVPPEEEVLASMLILQYREDWLRNEATCAYSPGCTDVYKNPFGGLLDGVADAQFTAGFGQALQQLMGGN